MREHKHFIENNQPYMWSVYTYGKRFHPFNKNVFGIYFEPGLVLGAEKQRWLRHSFCRQELWRREKGTWMGVPCSVIAVQVPGILRIEKRLLCPDLPLLGCKEVTGDFNTIIKSGWRCEGPRSHRYNNLTQTKS